MGKNQYRRENLYKAIVIYTDQWGQTKGAKYRNILADRPASWNQSVAYWKKKFPSATHVNLYGGITGQFVRRENIQN